MTKRIWKLYKEVRSLRRKVKTLENDLEYSNRRFNTLYYEKTQQEKYYNTMLMKWAFKGSTVDCCNNSVAFKGEW